VFDHLLESSRRSDSNKWSTIGFEEEAGIIGKKICTLSGALLFMYIKGLLLFWGGWLKKIKQAKHVY